MEQIEIRIFDKNLLKTNRAIKSLNFLNNKMVVLTDTKDNIFISEELTNEEFQVTCRIPKVFKSSVGTARLGYPGGVIKIDSSYHIMDGNKKVLYRYDMESKEIIPYISLIPHINSSAASIMNSSKSIITDTVFDDYKIWFTCVAGYSSSVCCYDLNNNTLEHKFFTRGPKPTGLALTTDKKNIYVLDASNRQISKFDPFGKWDGTKENIHDNNPEKSPIGLTIDKNGKIIVSVDKLDSSLIKKTAVKKEDI